MSKEAVIEAIEVDFFKSNSENGIRLRIKLPNGSVAPLDIVGGSILLFNFGSAGVRAEFTSGAFEGFTAFNFQKKKLIETFVKEKVFVVVS